MTAPFPSHKQEEWRYADLDALKPVWEQFAEPVTLTVGAGINRIMRGPDKGVLLITHYQRLLDYVEPDKVHVLQAGKITCSGDIELARELENTGYAEAAA